jgi:uncharacterized tellurite resistance protein B-like protein
MIERLKALLSGRAGAAETKPDELRLATAALLLETAVLDGHFGDDERVVIQSVLEDHFGLNGRDAAALIADARQAVEDAGELYGFTKVVKDSYPPEDRISIIEMLWRVAYADGELHDYEANLVRRVAGLIYVADQDSGAARKRVLAERDETAG